MVFLVVLYHSQCKIALLNEKSEDTMEVYVIVLYTTASHPGILYLQCIKRYKRAKAIFEHLFAEAKTTHDKQILQRCEFCGNGMG